MVISLVFTYKELIIDLLQGLQYTEIKSQQTCFWFKSKTILALRMNCRSKSIRMGILFRHFRWQYKRTKLNP